MTMQAYRGKGKVFAGLFSSGATLPARALFPIGNASDFSFTFEVEEATLENFQNAAGGNAASITKISNFRGTIAFREMSESNLAMLLSGTSSAGNATAIVGESGYKIVPLAFIPTARLIDTTVAPVVKKGATVISTADYTVSNGGITIAETITTATVVSGDSITIDYTPLLSHSVETLIRTPVDYSLVFEGVNEVDSKWLTVKIHKVKLSPPSSVALIGTDFYSGDCTFTASADSTITGAGLSQYAEIEIQD
jgi:uncharacterized Zn-binding protein involved in type VI secretion